MSEQSNIIVKVGIQITDLIASSIVLRAHAQSLNSHLRAELIIAKAMGSTKTMSHYGTLIAEIRATSELSKTLLAGVDALKQTILACDSPPQELRDLAPTIRTVLDGCIDAEQEVNTLLKTFQEHLEAVRV
jgi:hypothetical protein